MSALRKSVKRPVFWIKWIAAAALAAAAIFDWTRPPAEQASARFFERGIVTPYRRWLHPYTGRFIRCRYQPTCSYYAAQAVHVHGLPKGLWLTTKRLLRCHPWVPFGTLDPVPPPKPQATPVRQTSRLSATPANGRLAFIGHAHPDR